MKQIRVWSIGGLLGNGNAEVLEKNTFCSATLSTTNPTRTHQRLPSDNMYHNLQLQNTLTLAYQTVVCLTNETPGWKIKKKKVFQIPKWAGLFCPPSLSGRFRGPVSVPPHERGGGGLSPNPKWSQPEADHSFLCTTKFEK